MGLVVQTIVSCVPPFIQQAGIEAINGDQSIIADMLVEYQQRRDVMVAGLNTIPGIKCVRPEGALYAFANISGTGMSSEQFANFALEEAGVALLPGNSFGVHGEGYIRLSYVNTLENIERAIGQLTKAMKES